MKSRSVNKKNIRLVKVKLGCPYDMWLRQMDRHFVGGGDCHQETERLPVKGRCGNALPQRMLPLTD